jgi:hypothetical protein
MGYPNHQPALIDASIGLTSKRSLTRKFHQCTVKRPIVRLSLSGLA